MVSGKVSRVAGGVILLAGMACASQPPSEHLQRARAEISAAHSDHTRRLNPEGLHLAEQALHRAESAHEEDAGSQEEQHLAYLAHRRAVIARADADTRAAAREQHRVQKRYTRLLERAVKRERQAPKDKTIAVHGKALIAARPTSAAAQPRPASLSQPASSAPSAPQTARQGPQVAERGGTTLLTIPNDELFRPLEAMLVPSAYTTLRKLAEALQGYQGSQPIVIEGHTDARGPESFNRSLSEQRAEAIRAYLDSMGVPMEKIEAIGKGESEPVASNGSAETRASNGRIEIEIPAPVRLSMDPPFEQGQAP